MTTRDQKPKPEDTKYEEAEEVGLEGLVPDDPKDEDSPPAEDTRTPFDEA